MTKVTDLNQVKALTQWIGDGDDAKDNALYAGIVELTNALPYLVVARQTSNDYDRKGLDVAINAIANTVENLRDVYNGVWKKQ
jgi:hypothetical protein